MLTNLYNDLAQSFLKNNYKKGFMSDFFSFCFQ
jgi:hypothetical protein